MRRARGAVETARAARAVHHAARAVEGVSAGRALEGLLKGGARANPLAVAGEILKAPARVRRIRRGRRGFFRRAWLGLRDVALRPALGIATGDLVD